ncbi:MAG: glycerol-3-phosphate dehydrogenase (NAD(P)+) [Candidatus Kentron sp. G]|nr:MAG: glycerol-3-phosphate dehydrogenase (NAD(P)+) [Candidatus Kentron sp. G]VFN02085.1 MAG: glycerol-3-phosphate dehydrogenase (NAD(P)+) [Candidatus Kentron sp. G]VFN03568.1 MAG: glycerol-3-phosphate dehydrogenase (NAD(P)+) [Candidatus Kentron sp. G]
MTKISNILDVAIVGSGTMGTALAHIAACAGHRCTLLTDDAQVAAGISDTHCHPVFFQGLSLHPTLRSDTEWAEHLCAADLLIVAVPSYAMRDTAQRIAPATHAEQAVLSVSKGFEPDTHKPMSEVLHETLPTAHIGALSGPNITLDLIKNLPTRLVVASASGIMRERGRLALSTAQVAITVSDDRPSFEYASALKNIVAFEVGIVTGLGLGDNFRALVMAEGMAEIRGLLAIMGLQAEVFYGLAGLSDIFLTCSSAFAQNYATGVKLGEGSLLEELVALLHAKGEVAEGVESVKAGFALAKQCDYTAPLLAATHKFMYETADGKRDTADFLAASLM